MEPATTYAAAGCAQAAKSCWDQARHQAYKTTIKSATCLPARGVSQRAAAAAVRQVPRCTPGRQAGGALVTGDRHAPAHDAPGSGASAATPRSYMRSNMCHARAPFARHVPAPETADVKQDAALHAHKHVRMVLACKQRGTGGR